jgi:hypothetical protein
MALAHVLRLIFIAGATGRSCPDLYDPIMREEHYRGNLAEYLVDLHDANATFDFCGGMMFQLVLTPKLRAHLAEVAAAGADDARQPVMYDADTRKMQRMPGYSKDAEADNVRVFHGREVRDVPHAAGDMSFVLQLSHADSTDEEGWTAQERAGYDGWGHDSRRTWRRGERLEREGFVAFRSTFGAGAFTLHHRFYLHRDAPRDRLWLAAEDGCEGFPAKESSMMRGPPR